MLWTKERKFATTDAASTPPFMTNEQLWVLVMHYERIIALLLEQLDDDDTRKDFGIYRRPHLS